MPRAPFVSRAVLILLHGQSASSRLTHRDHTLPASQFPDIDALAAAGISTDIVYPLSPHGPDLEDLPEQVESALRGLLTRDVRGVAKPPAAAAKSLSSYQLLPLSLAHAATSALPLRALTVVDAGADVDGANALVRRLLPRAMDPADAAAPAACPASLRTPLLLGVMCVSPRWPRRAPQGGGGGARDGGVGAAVFRPRQSADAGVVDPAAFKLGGERSGNRLQVVGSVAWAGAGATRVDEITCLDGRVRGGDGELLLSQMLNEVLAKVGLVEKFGA